MSSTTSTAPAGHPHRSAIFAMSMLALCCLFWGVSFPVNQLGINTLDQARLAHAGSTAPATPLESTAVAGTFAGWRFLLAALIFGLANLAALRRVPSGQWRGAALIGLAFGTAMLLQMLGLRYTRPSVSGFLTALTVVFAPLSQALLLRRAVPLLTWVSVGLALSGAVSMSFQQSGAVNLPTPPFPYFGELLTVVAALLFTVQMLLLDHYGQNGDTKGITFAMFLSSGLVCGGVGAALAGGELYPLPLLQSVWSSSSFLLSMALLIVFCTLAAIHLMNVYQPHIQPATASVVYCLEPVFALKFSLLIGTEHLTPQTVTGSLLILGAVLVLTRVPQAR